MFLRDIRLLELSQAVVTCSGLASLSAALKLFNQNDRVPIVVTDSLQQPLGLLKFERLLPAWYEAIKANRETKAASADALNLLKTSIQAIAPTVIEPIALLPVDWTIDQFLLHIGTSTLEEQPQITYALVDAQGYCVGLLNCDNLLRRVAKIVTTPSSQEQDAPDSEALEAKPPPKQQHILALTQQFVAQKTALEQQLKVRQEQLKTQREEIEALQRNAIALPVAQLLAASGAENISYSLFSRPSILHALLHLVERLPFPLMLQTSKGRIISQNSVWQSQVGELSDPLKLWHEASIYLDTQSPSFDRESQPHSSLATLEPTIASESIASELSDSSYPQLDEPSGTRLNQLSGQPPSEQPLCQSGANSDSCVCICPLKDGQEQVLRFVKISLGTLLPNLQFDWATLAQTRQNTQGSWSTIAASVEPSSEPFQLATLISPHGENVSVQENQEAVSQTNIESLWLVLAQDVTKQQDLAKELTAKNADLVHLNRLKDEFLACISHELKTPLTAVLGLSSLLKDQTLGQLNQKQVHYAQLIYQSSRHLMGVVNDILDLTRIETGQFDLLFDPVNIATACSSAFEQAKQIRLAESKASYGSGEEPVPAQFSLEIEPGLTTLVADELRLKQMLAHLLSNSLKFTEHQKPIGLKVNRWGGWIAFTVWDTGIGIPADKQHLIFQKFQQLENPLTRQFEGAGLGLVLTHRLARLHGGDVTFISKEGQGSQFTILLPPSPPNKTQLNWGDRFEEESEDWRVAASRHSAPSLTHRIPLEIPRNANSFTANDRTRLTLIVEAVPQFVETLTHQLTGLGYRAVIARSGTEAIEKARRIQPCIIFLDPFLPLLSGWDVLTLLKSNPETQHIPIVITASGIDEEQAHKNQANGVLKVPIQHKELKRLLKQFDLEIKESHPPHAHRRLTILRLSPKGDSTTSLLPDSQLNSLLQAHQHRVLESDDLEQAELLVKIWKPNAVLLECPSGDPNTYLKRFSSYPALASLPLITLDQVTTQAANQVPGLLVFPCLLSQRALTEENSSELSKLLQVLQIAIESIWKSSVLAIDLSTLQMAVPTNQSLNASDEVLGTFPKETEWLQALMQYLQTAGLRSRIGRSWQEVMQQIEAHNADLLLFCWTGGEPSLQVLEMLSTFHHLSFKPPIIVLDHRDPELGDETVIPLPDPVRKIATRILSPTVSMAELLEQIEQVMQQETSDRSSYTKSLD